MGAGTTSSQSTTAPLTAAQRQDLYYGSVGDILNTYNSSGLPTNGTGSMTGGGTGTPATFNPQQGQQTVPMSQGANGTWSSGLNGSSVSSPAGEQPGTTPYNATGNMTTGFTHSGGLTAGGSNVNGPSLTNPFLTAATPNVQMPTGAPSPGGVNFPTYQTPQYQGAGQYQTVGNQTDPTLYNNILKGYTDPLDAAKATDTTNYNNSAAERGIWSSGLALQGQNDIDKAYAPQYTAAGGQATSALQSELSGENTYNAAQSNAANTFNQGNAQNTFSSGWAPLNYLSSLYAGTAGNIGGTNTFGANISV